MTHSFSLNILKSDDHKQLGETRTFNNISIPGQGPISRDNINKQKIILNMPIDHTYIRFVSFMTNPQYIRFSLDDRIESKKLAELFNTNIGINISSNAMFPKLMKRFIEDHPQYGILKKSMTKGITYLYVGNTTNPAFGKRLPTKTIEERNTTVRDERYRVLNNMMNIICQRTGWSLLEYQRMVDLKFVTIVSLNNEINIEATIQICKGRLVEYIYKVLAELGVAVRNAKIVKDDFICATKNDIELTPINSSARYTDRFRASERIYDVLNGLESALRKYNNTIIGLPRLDYIVYSDTQYLQTLIDWLRANTKHNTDRQMVREHRLFEYQQDIDNETEEAKMARIIDAETLVTRLMYAGQH